MFVFSFFGRLYHLHRMKPSKDCRKRIILKNYIYSVLSMMCF